MFDGDNTSDTCCFCCSTRTGTLIIGIMCLVVALSGLIGYVILLVTGDESVKIYIESIYGEDVLESYALRPLITIIALIMGLLFVVVSSMLIHAVRKMRPGRMVPFMAFIVANLIIGSITTFLSIVNGTVTYAALLFVVVIDAIGSYCVLVMCSYYRELKYGFDGTAETGHDENGYERLIGTEYGKVDERVGTEDGTRSETVGTEDRTPSGTVGTAVVPSKS